MNIYITTLGRPRKQITLMGLPEKWRDQCHLVVQEHEYLLHRDIWGGWVRSIIPLPPDITTLGGTRKFLCENLTGKVILMDDDLTFYRRANADTVKLVKMQPTVDYDAMFEDIEKALDEYAHVGVSARSGNQQFKENQLNSRYMRVLAYRLPMDANVQHGRVDGMSDFDIALQLCKLGYPSFVFYDWSQDQPGTQKPGGCALNRTLETHAREVEFMAQAHPGLVTKRTVAKKGGTEFDTRPEVTIFWKKAYKHG